MGLRDKADFIRLIAQFRTIMLHFATVLEASKILINKFGIR